MNEQMQEPEKELIHPIVAIKRHEDGSGVVNVKNLTIYRPGTTETLVEDINFSLQPGQSLIITGASGTGKSVMLKNILGQLASGKGNVELPPSEEIMMISQKNHFSRQSVHGVLTYPKLPSYFTHQQSADALRAVGHDRLIQYIPGIQTRHVIDLLALKIPALLDNYEGQKKLDKKIQYLQENLLKATPHLTDEYFPDIDLLLSQHDRAYLAEKLTAAMDKNLGHSTPQPYIQSLASALTQALNDNLTKKLMKSLSADTFALSQKCAGALKTMTIEQIDAVSRKLRQGFQNRIAKRMSETRLEADIATDNPAQSVYGHAGALTRTFKSALKWTSTLFTPSRKNLYFTPDECRQIGDKLAAEVENHLAPRHTCNQFLNESAIAPYVIKRALQLTERFTGAPSLTQRWQEIEDKFRRKEPLGSTTQEKPAGISDHIKALSYEFMRMASGEMCGITSLRNAFSQDMNRINNALLFLRQPLLHRRAKQAGAYLAEKAVTHIKNQQRDGITLSRTLSGGQQQRVVLARALLHHPQVLIMDEPTSALDGDAALQLYKDIINSMPDTVIMGVAHDHHLIELHDQHGELKDKKLHIHAVAKQDETIKVGLTI